MKRELSNCDVCGTREVEVRFCETCGVDYCEDCGLGAHDAMHELVAEEQRRWME